jgi:predicted nucleic acid-binding protein
VYLERGLMNMNTALELLQESEAFFKGKEYSVSSDHVLALAYRSKCSAYDCEFVALAEDLEISLVTADKQILKAFPSVALSLI